jgi:uncharacterized membrane protein YdfJ with MMPL/SSD domain
MTAPRAPRPFDLLAAVAGIVASVAFATWLTLRGNGQERHEQPEPNGPTATASPPGPAAPQGPMRELHPTGAFAALGRFDYRYRRWVPVVGLLIVIGLNVWGAVAGGRLIQGGWVIPGSEEQRYVELVADRFGEEETAMLVVYRDPDGDAASSAFQELVSDAVAPLADDPAVTEITTYAESGAEELLSRDGTATMALITLDKPIEESVEDAERLDELVERPEGVETWVTGIPQAYHEFNEQIEQDLLTAELVSLPIAAIILLTVFGTLVGASLPLIIAAMALPSTFAVVGLLAGVTDMSIFVTNLASMIGLALAIDYSLFMVSRFREELRHHTVEVAVERMMGTVGKAVAVSGIAVTIGLSSLTVFEADALRSMGIGGVVTVVSTMVFGLTVLPALLGMLGPRVNRLRVPLPSALRLAEDDPDLADQRSGRGVWAWIAARVMRRPILIATPVLALLLLAGSPFLSLRLSTGQNLEDLPRTPARTGFEVVADEFPGGQADPIAIAVSYGSDLEADGVSPEAQEALRGYVEEIAEFDGVTEVESVLDPPPGVSADQYAQLLALPEAQRPADVREGLATYLESWVGADTTKVRVFSDRLPDSAEGRELVGDVRDLDAPAGATVLTGGLPSRSTDFMAGFTDSIPVAVAIVVAVTAIVLFLTFGSVFLPVKAVLMSLISISASFGALVWIFQQGNLSEILGFESSGTIGAWLPVLMFAIVFGLSMDYEVLLLSRIRERYLVHGDNRRAVAEGIGITGGIITGAALIMVAVFGAFALSSITFIKAIGFSMALAVLIDATIVRGILVPAFMRVMGSVNWWAPRWVQRAVARIGLYEGAAPDARSTAAVAHRETKGERTPAGSLPVSPRATADE